MTRAFYSFPFNKLTSDKHSNNVPGIGCCKTCVLKIYLKFFTYQKLLYINVPFFQLRNKGNFPPMSFLLFICSNGRINFKFYLSVKIKRLIRLNELINFLLRLISLYFSNTFLQNTFYFVLLSFFFYLLTLIYCMLLSITFLLHIGHISISSFKCFLRPQTMYSSPNGSNRKPEYTKTKISFCSIETML